MLTTVAVSLAGVVVLAAAGLLAYRAASQRRAARSLAVRTPNGIDESRYVPIGGIGQWIQIRGEDRANPVLLFLHGAGMSMIPFTPVFRSSRPPTGWPWRGRRPADGAGPPGDWPGSVLRPTPSRGPGSASSGGASTPKVEAPAKNLVLLPGGGHCAVLMQPAAFLAELRACINGTPTGTSGPGSR